MCCSIPLIFICRKTKSKILNIMHKFILLMLIKIIILVHCIKETI